MKFKTLPVFLAFFVMGIADAMGPLADAVKKQYQLSNVMATLLPFFVFIAFAVFSVPGGMLAARIGKKKLLLLALAINGAGVLVPSLAPPAFVLLLACIFVLGAGTTFLQVAGNPIMRDVSAPGVYARNLSFAQFIKGMGSAGSTYLVGLVALLPLLGAMDWRGVFPVFTVLMAVTFMAVLAMPVTETKADTPPGIGGSLALLGRPVFALAVTGIFLYVGAEVCLARFLKPTLEGFGLTGDQAALYGPSMFFIMLTVGRLVGSAVLNFMQPRSFFRLSSALGVLGLLAVMSGINWITFTGVVACGLGFANIWPLLFSITVEEKPERAAELSGLMCMAISGGAILPLLMGRLLDTGLAGLSYLVPLAAFVYLLLLALAGRPTPRLALVRDE